MTTVIKIGGTLIGDDEALETLWRSVKEMGGRVIIVHGGGPHATEIARSLGHEPRMVHGRRVTTELDLRIVQWTMRGELNSRLVAGAFKSGIRAVGLAGSDAGLVRVVKRPPWTIDGEQIDFGLVGDVQEVDPTVLNLLLDGGFIPVVAPLGIDMEGRLYNVNADTVSCEIASSIDAQQYLLVTDSGGVRRDAADASTLMETCSTTEFAAGLEEGWIQGGMRVKLQVAFDALKAGVRDVFVLPPEGIIDHSRGTKIIE
ncbi:MAG: acetylglutamate kinase [Rhodothermales bacterium]